MRLFTYFLSFKCPWRSPIEPGWLRTKRRVIETSQMLGGQELAERVCNALDCVYHDHITVPEKST